MTRDDIIRMAREAEAYADMKVAFRPRLTRWHITRDERFAKLVAEALQKHYMQLFLDPENQPTQFGTATQEYREQEIAEIRDLLFALAYRIRTTHLYGMEVQKMLEKAEAIRARGEATSRGQ